MTFKRLVCNSINTAPLMPYLLFLLLALCALSAQASGVGRGDVTGFVSERAWVEDPGGDMTLDEVKRAEQIPLAGTTFSQGHSQSVFWIRLRIDPATLDDPSGQDLVIRLLPPYQDQIWLYDPLASDDRVRVTGDYYDWRDDEYHSLNLNFVIPADTEPRDVWLRLKTSASTLTFIEVLTLDQARAADRRQEVFT